MLTTNQQITLCDQSGDWQTSVTIDPTRGGAILDYSSNVSGERLDWLHPADRARPACFPMLPFCSRVRDGRFRFGGRDVVLPANNPPELHAIHGHGFQRKWRVLEADDRRAVLEYEHDEADWPWCYRARQDIRLSGRNLSIALSVVNCAAQSMPCGLGLHPFFPCDARLRAEVARWLRLDEQGMPVSLAEMPADLPLGEGVDLADRVMDHVFTGWNRRATLSWPTLGRSLEMQASKTCGHMVVYAPADEPYVCVEPVSNVPDAFNTQVAVEDAYQTLAPGATLSLVCRFEPSLGN